MHVPSLVTMRSDIIFHNAPWPCCPTRAAPPAGAESKARGALRFMLLANDAAHVTIGNEYCTNMSGDLVLLSF